MKKLIIIAILSLTLIAQTTNSPTSTTTQSVLIWDKSPESEGVLYYTVLANGKPAGIVTTNKFPLEALRTNGVYSMAVTAHNAAGASEVSTNLVVQYVARPPYRPGGLKITQ